LLEKLPHYPSASWMEKGARLLADEAAPDAMKQDCLSAAIALLEKPEHAWLWKSQPRYNERELSASLPDSKGMVTTLRPDLLLKHDRCWHVVDYKTGQRPASLPEAYRAQMQAYQEACRMVWPEEPVRGWILWVEDARLEEVVQAA
jgi:ATP-dependent exoDNAse (exonuclease V) beta subunit